ncbi:GNAT family N-acetyltransferase [Flammeovirgaceae bacterium SG7u.111]|nr:N-acetyltransferase family protein [Flammeovirgaceae bacterium SG7u.132]WPO37040.1 GNAT family N-acetyltransferase [Flammeovirgaceae bacterium SG7u.111]
MATINIKPLTEEDWEAVEKIYLEGIATGNATLDSGSPGWESWDKSHLQECRLVAIVENKIAGWIALSPVSSRCVYQGVAEVSIYIGEKFRGMGLGYKLFDAIFITAEDAGIWTLQASMFPENLASQRLHEKAGFRKVGVREKIAKHKGKWRDTLIMERRSKAPKFLEED